MLPGISVAQDAGSSSSLASLDTSSLKGEIQRRYDEALAGTQDATILANAGSPYLWAQETKAQCGIALGFLKSNTRDPESIRKCEKFHAMMVGSGQSSEPAPPPPAACVTGPFLVFFDWNEAVLRPDAGTVLDNAISQYQGCGSARINLAGHADRSGSDRYNVGLSQRRNDTVRAYLESRGVGGGLISAEAFGESQPRVATEDGVREPQNRRVEMTISQ